VTLDGSGSLYLADYQNHRICKVDSGGTITTIAGAGTAGYSGDGGPAFEAQFSFPSDLAFDPSGNLYIADAWNHCVRRIDATGLITTLAGTGIGGYNGDAMPAVEAQLYGPKGVAVDAEGNLYISDGNYRIRRVNVNGVITTAVGSGVRGYSGDGGPPGRAELNGPFGVAVDALHRIYVSDIFNHTVRRVSYPASFAETVDQTGFAFVEDGELGHILTDPDLHLYTTDLDTGRVILTFAYDGQKRLISVTDQLDNQVRIERGAGGAPTAIVSPDGVTTSLTVDGSNHLTGVL
jgi:YD repeat-containing protein